ncbi:glycoside hydrolase family 9 protein [Ignavibacterium sp.]|uniref:glycoside hydrolase family 9 protein n=1 Tax=Ignavibacterium sp. TaxID=2651167 RepID=UPI00307F8A7F
MTSARIFLFIVLSLLFYSCSQIDDNIFIRLNQVGFRPEEIKTAIILSKTPFESKTFRIKKIENKTEVFSDSITLLPKKLNEEIPFAALINFTSLNINGEYFIEYDHLKSYPFIIDEAVFNSVRDSLSLFFKVQRCGPTNPLLHKVCHLQDATKVIGYSDSSSIDLTGGWHDAGDYIKFLYTTAFTTYLLLFSYEFDSQKFSFDLDLDSVPDILQEARIGLDFLLRCNFADDAFITQVQDDRDHSVGWRLPENDTLTFDRPAFVKMNKSQIGISSAALAIASRIWGNKFSDYEFSKKCLDVSKKIFQLRDKITDFNDDEKYYAQTEFDSKLALGALEIYKTSNEKNYLNLALEFGNKINENHWWSWGNFNALVYYNLSEFDDEFIYKLKKQLDYYKTKSENNLFSLAHHYNWGTNHSLAGIVLSTILYKQLTGSDDFDNLAILNRDFILGRNPWGKSFITNVGTDFPKKVHHQIAFFSNGYIPGALVSGPAPDTLFTKFNFTIPDDELKIFNTSAIYSDDIHNFITNEPTISSNATALFIFGYYSN